MTGLRDMKRTPIRPMTVRERGVFWSVFVREVCKGLAFIAAFMAVGYLAGYRLLPPFDLALNLAPF